MSDTKTGFCLFLINHLLVPRDRQQRLAGEMVPGKGFELSQRMLADFKSAVSAIPPSGHEYLLFLKYKEKLFPTSPYHFLINTRRAFD